MDFFETVKARGSYRDKFEEKPMPEEDIRKICEAGIMAPSGYNLQSTGFIAVTDKDLRKQISDLMPSDATRTAPLILVVASEKIEADGLCFEIEDYGSATETMALAVTALGYATVWMDGDTKENGNSDKIKKILDLPENKTVRTILPIGKPLKPVKQNSRKPFEERVTFK